MRKCVKVKTPIEAVTTKRQAQALAGNVSHQWGELGWGPAVRSRGS